MQDIESLIGNADEFPILRNWDFFNHAGVSPLPHVCAEAFGKFAAHIESNSYLDAQWHPDIEILRQNLAALINAHRDEIAFVKNTSEGLSFVAHGIEWNPGDRIVTTGVEYPANVYPWMDVAQRKGVELIMVSEEESADGPRQVPLEKILIAADHPQTKLVTLSHVEFGSGQRHDLAAIGEFCSQRKIRFCVDGIQSLGILPVDVRAMKIDYLSADSHKWLLGPEAAGVFFIRRELIEQTHPSTIGWLNVTNPTEFGKFNFVLKSTAQRFECGSLNVPGLLAFKASLELLQSVGIEQIAGRIHTLTNHLISNLKLHDFGIASPRENQQWSGIVSFIAPRGNHEMIVPALRKQKIEIALRLGRLRCSPHFYNTEEQIGRLVDGIMALDKQRK